MERGSARDDAGAPRWHALALFAALAAVYVALPLGRFFSDSSLFIAHVADPARGWRPVYNVAYAPVAWGFQAVFGGLFDSLEDALTALSALAFAGAVALAHRLLAAAGARGAALWAWTALLAAAPGILLHVGIVEVHGVQALGAVLALSLAHAARRAPPHRAALALLLALPVALFSHLSHVLLLPGLVVVAWSGSRERGVRVGRGWFVAAALALVPLWLAIRWLKTEEAVDAAFHDPAWQWAFMIVQFHDMLAESIASDGWRTPLDMARYVGDELVRPAGLLALAPLVTVLAWRRLDAEGRALSWRLGAAMLPALLVLPQGGVWERGGYYMTYLPVLALAGALASDAPRAGAGARRAAVTGLLAMLVAGQLLLAPGERRRLVESGPEPRDWAARVATALRDGDKVLTAGSAKTMELDARHPGVVVADLARWLEYVPSRGRLGRAAVAVAEFLRHPEHHGDVYLDGALFRWPRSRDTMRELFLDPRIAAEPVAGLPDGYELVRVRLVVEPQQPPAQPQPTHAPTDGG